MCGARQHRGWVGLWVGLPRGAPACWAAAGATTTGGDGNNEEKGYRRPCTAAPQPHSTWGAPDGGRLSLQSRRARLVGSDSGASQQMPGPVRPRSKLPWRASGLGAGAGRRLPATYPPACSSGLDCTPPTQSPSQRPSNQRPHARPFVTKTRWVDDSCPAIDVSVGAGCEILARGRGPAGPSLLSSLFPLRVRVWSKPALCCSQPNCRRVAVDKPGSRSRRSSPQPQRSPFLGFGRRPKGHGAMEPANGLRGRTRAALRPN